MTPPVIFLGLALALGIPSSVAAARDAQLVAPDAGHAERLAKARAIGVAMGVERRTAEMLQQFVVGSGDAMLAELELTAAGLELLAALDRDFPGGRAAFAQEFEQELATRFAEALPLYAEKGAELIVAAVSPEDLDAWHSAVIGLDGLPRTGDDAARARDMLNRSGAMQRIAATSAGTIQGLQTFGQILGERLGVESFDAVAARHPEVFGEKP